MQRRTTVGNFDPYHQWLGIPPGKWMPNHFELLGLSIDEKIFGHHLFGLPCYAHAIGMR